jgi:hypothetical protein
MGSAWKTACNGCTARAQQLAAAAAAASGASLGRMNEARNGANWNSFACALFHDHEVKPAADEGRREWTGKSNTNAPLSSGAAFIRLRTTPAFED